jgi:RNA recognition motif-containing protein
MKGLPFRVTFEEIQDFFKDHPFVEDSVKCAANQEGRRNGFGAILFKNTADAQKAIDSLDGEYIGSRFVKLFLINYGEYKTSDGIDSVGDGGSGRPSRDESTCKLADAITDENKGRCLVMKGCPWRVTTEEIIEFFENGGATLTADNVFIEQEEGKRTGRALVRIEDSDVAAECRKELYKKEIGPRYILLFGAGHAVMEEIINGPEDE